MLACLLVYTAACIGCASCQRKLIYYPQHLTTGEMNDEAREAGLQRWTNASGQAIGLKRLSPRQPASGRVVICYGNGNWTIGCAHYASEIQKIAPLDVFILEYPGYADRPGLPSEKHNFQAADEALELLDTNRPLFLVGESLGTGVAAYLAGTHPDRIAGMMLLSPYNSLTSVGQYHMPLLPVGLILVDRYPSADYLRHQKCFCRPPEQHLPSQIIEI
jgi:uncharacterized protein